VSFLVEEPTPDEDAKRQFKYPFAACEIFCCEVEGVYNTLLESDELLDRLFSLLRMERPLNSMLAGYFARVVGSLLLRRTPDVMLYLQRRQELLPALVHHVDTTSVAEVLARLVGADEPLRGHNSAAAMQWLSETDLLQLLVVSLGPDAPAEGQANAAEVLAAVARSISSPLTRSMASAEFMQRLVDSALGPHDGCAAPHALNVCIALLEPLPPPDPTMGPSMQPGAVIQEQLRGEAIRCISGAADRMVALLGEAENSKELFTSYGVVRPPVGQLRLKAVDLLAALLRTADPQAEAAVMASGGVQRSMELFLKYPFNNALHGGVAALLTSFEPGSDELRQYLLEDAKLVDWIASAPENVTPEQNPEAPLVPNRSPLRAGYCGHITQIANRLLNLAESCVIVRDFLAGHDAWETYVRDRLEPRNKLESVFAWQCGRPSTHGGELSHDATLYSGEMSFPSLDAGAFSREVYQRYGVYEDDEDDEEGAAPEWVMELSGAARENPGKLSGPPVSFAAAFEEGSGSDSDGENAEGIGGEVSVVVSEQTSDHVVDLPVGGVASSVAALGPTTMADMQNDAVVMEDIEAAEGLMSLQAEMESLGVRDGSNEEEKMVARTAANNNGDIADVQKEQGNSSAAKENCAAAKDFNSNAFWKPTFSPSIEDEGP